MFPSVSQSRSTTPLQLQAVASGYVSNRADFQDMFNKISAGTVKAIEGLRDPETQANRLQDRIDSRQARADKKGMTGKMIADTSKALDGKSVKPVKTKRDQFDEKTANLKTKQEGYKNRADEAMQERIEQARALRSASTKYSEDFGENAKAGYDLNFLAMFIPLVFHFL